MKRAISPVSRDRNISSIAARKLFCCMVIGVDVRLIVICLETKSLLQFRPQDMFNDNVH